MVDEYIITTIQPFFNPPFVFYDYFFKYTIYCNTCHRIYEAFDMIDGQFPKTCWCQQTLKIEDGEKDVQKNS